MLCERGAAMASPALSPLLESLCEVTAQRKGCPVNIVVLGISSESRVALLRALVGEGKAADAAVEFAEAKSHGSLRIRETQVGTINSARVFITQVSVPSPTVPLASANGDGGSEAGHESPDFNLESLRRHLQRHRAASAILYTRTAGPLLQPELAFLSALESSLGPSLWHNAVCATVTLPSPTPATVTLTPTGEDDVPAAGAGCADDRAGAEAEAGFLDEVVAAACAWDGTHPSTAAVSDSLALVVSTHLPFVPEPGPAHRRPSQGNQGNGAQGGSRSEHEHERQLLALEAQSAFGDLDLVSSANLSLLSAPQLALQEPRQALGAPPLAWAAQASSSCSELQGVASDAAAAEAAAAGTGAGMGFSLALTTPGAPSTAAAAGGPLVHQPQLVPAFASLSMAFGAPALYSSGALARGGMQRAHPHGRSTSGASQAPLWNTPGATAVAGPAAALQGIAAVRAPAVMAAGVPGGRAAAASLSFLGYRLSLPGGPASFSGGSLGADGLAKINVFPDYFRLTSGGQGFPGSRPNLRRVVMVWFRNDLRVHDNEALSAANNDGVAVLPVYCFDPRDYGKSSSGFERTGRCRAQFLLQCVSDLRTRLRARGSDLIVRVGRPEVELPRLAKATGATALYAHSEVTKEDWGIEQTVSAKLKEVGAASTFFWGSTLYHLQDLPFKLDGMPCNYGGFREAIKTLKVRPILRMPQRLKLIPRAGNVGAGDIPTLAQLGLGSPSQITVGLKELKGGEGEGIRKLKSFLAEAMALNPQAGAGAGAAAGAGGGVGNSSVASGAAANSSIAPYLLGAKFSCNIAPWLATGCLSPRRMLEEMRKVVPSTSCEGADAGTATGVSLDWLVFELLWRDFFRFITKKHALAPKEAPAAAPVPA